MVVTVAGSLGLVAGTAAAAPSQLGSYDQQLIKLVNQARSQAGLPAVVEARGLTRLSVDWSTQMANQGQLKHNPNAWTQLLSYGASNRTAWAENVARWSSDAYTPEETFAAYMASPGHKANILGAEYRYVGMGTITGVGEDDYNTMTFTDRVEAGQAVDGSSGGGTAPTNPTTPTNPGPSNPGSGGGQQQAINPTGSFDGGSLAGTTYTLSGWAFDGNSPTTPLNVDVYDTRPDGTSAGTRLLADRNRPDIARVFPAAGAAHGFEGQIQLRGSGRHRVCAFAINTGPGSNVVLGCRDVDVPGPTGSFDGAVSSAPGRIDVSGWVSDVAAPGNSEVHVYVAGPNGRVGTPGIRTGAPRTDVARVFPWAGGNTGWSASVAPQGAGVNEICAFAINANPPGANPLLGCRTVTVRDAFGVLDGVSVSGGRMTVSGWALNPNNPGEQVEIHVYDSGPSGTKGYSGNRAGAGRPDVAAVFPGYGANHGYSISQPITGRGRHSICAFAITTGGGAGNPLLGCRDVTI
ncbi:CAP domain-containing protein [Nakamurella leprariae]|uniref:CAP domain-containing protein n=1 Tax=Nakamurella leprariae TaxID=2803911 RepID=A0A938YDQ9_9ACTN|nr:CAP domain-containing protein [Nakamurella leprariae]MBM9467698.1 CAP domain-containing protein [Nakamurella leprariae]